MTGMRIIATIFCCVLMLPGSADARPRKSGKPVYDYRQPKGGCGKFGWPVTREIEWFARIDKPEINSGATRDALPAGAFKLDLDADSDATLVMPLERKSRSENGFGGSVTFAALPRGGLFQITLSEDALLDVIQGGHYLRKKASNMRRDCPGIRRSIRVELSPGPLVLQFGGVEAPAVTVAVAPVE